MDAVDEPEGVPRSEVKSLLATDKSSEDTDYDGPIEHVSDLIGSWGPFQKRLFLLAIIVYAVSPFSNASIDYYMIKSDFWCADARSQPAKSQANSCDVKSCNQWIHNTTRTTLIKEWDLVCDRFWIASLALSSYQFGYLISSFLIGIISDRYGRKVALIICTSSEIVCFFAGALSPSVEFFILTRFISGIGGYGRFVAVLLMLVESVGPKSRGKIVAAYEWVWHISKLTVIPIAYFVENFRHLYYGVACYQIFSLLVTIFKIPESIRWQVATGRVEAARRTLVQYVQLDSEEEKTVFSRKLDKLSQYLSKHNNTEEERSKTILDIWRVPRLLGYCLTLYAFWFVQTFFNYGLKYNALDLTGSYFINMAMMQQSSLFANAFVSWGVEKFNRRSILFTCMVIASISLFSSIPLAIDHIYLRNITLMIGTCVISISSMVNYIYTAELFPTTMRHLALGSCSVCGRIASIAAPFIIQLNRYTSIQVTLAGFASLGILGALMSLLLPETRGKEIPDTVQDMLEMTDKKITDKKHEEEVES
ncbi:organic cation transporter protein-like isoform X2 [Brevipalpus obovatus]|uniref:organic cation transporter protein-like isoform X2 n=1 Tax=Brevipalpus obovatus TaxID=246614 RepID=UPI003D9E5BD2